MLRRAREFKNFKLRARDGDIGNAREFYFDDTHWTVRYLVADTGGWLSGRHVLISPHALQPANEDERVLPVNLTKQQIEDSPSLASDRPVSRQYETEYFAYYGWPVYWYGPSMWGPLDYPLGRSVPDSAPARSSEQRHAVDDPHLRSTQAVTGYHLQAMDGAIGHIEDFIIDDETWSIRYLVVDTKNWWAGKRVLMAPQWIKRVSWSESKVFVKLLCETIKRSPKYTQEALNRDYETALHRHYDQPGYWTNEPAEKSVETVLAQKKY